jgi:hypothetical protein
VSCTLREAADTFFDFLRILRLPVCFVDADPASLQPSISSEATDEDQSICWSLHLQFRPETSFPIPYRFTN